MRLLLGLFVCIGLVNGDTPVNWTANYPPCNRHAELLKHEHMTIGVRMATSNLALAQQFRRAMDSWASILDLEWHEDETEDCSMELLDGEQELFQSAPDLIAARSHLPDRLAFQGWVAFNPVQILDESEMYSISVHEIGHLLGLHHSSNAKSVMYSFGMDGLEWLDSADLAALAARHKLRIATLDKPVKLISAHQGSGTP